MWQAARPPVDPSAAPGQRTAGARNPDVAPYLTIARDARLHKRFCKRCTPGDTGAPPARRSFLPVKDIAVHVRWRDFAGILLLVVVVLVAAGALRGGPLLTSTAQISLPVAALVCSAALGYLKQHYRT
jgi:hypothetical protein